MDTVVPKNAYVELTNYCNFRCAFCPHPYMERRKGMMDLGLAKDMLDMFRESGVEKVYIAGMGEPLLYPRIEGFIREASDRGLYTHLFTNGYLLTEDTVFGLYDAGLSALGISLHTHTQELYEKTHRSSIDFGLYLSRIKGAIRAKCADNKDTEVKIYLMRTSTSRLFRYEFGDVMSSKEELRGEIMSWLWYGVELAGELGILFDADWPSANGINPSMFKVGILPGVSVVSKLLLPWGIDYKKKIPAVVGACRGLQSEFGVLNNGDVTMCCEDYEGGTALGNLNGETLVDIFSKSYTKRSKRMLQWCIPPTPFCRRCRGGVDVRMWLATQLGSIAHHKLGIKVGGW